jgi:hypothetical protein
MMKHSNELFYQDGKQSDCSETVKTREFLRKLLSALALSIDKTNYEYLYELLIRLQEQLSHTAQQPELNHLLDCLGNGWQYDRDILQKLSDSLRNAENLIASVVRTRLGRCVDAARQNHFAVLTDAINDPDCSVEFIATLNHDVLIEQYLKNNEVSFSDGFTKPTDSESFGCFCMDRIGLTSETEDNTTLVIKLHGSLSWRSKDRKIIRLLRDDPGIEARLDQAGPLFLTGSFHKDRAYSFPVFSELRCAFTRGLASLDTLVVIGYGLGDHGINGSLVSRTFAQGPGQVIFVDRSANSLCNDYRHLFASPPEPLECEIADLSWRSLKEALDS